MLHTQEIFTGKNGISYTLRSPEAGRCGIC